MKIDKIAIILFDGFETLDVMGPVEIFGRITNCKIHFISIDGGFKTSSQGVSVETTAISTPEFPILLIPGGQGTRCLVNHHDYIQWIKKQSQYSSLCISVCTGSALLAKTGLLDGVKATSNKLAFDWVKSIGENVHWQSKARWVHDRKYYTSSGISAGIDMSLQIINDLYGRETALSIAKRMEYIWNDDDTNDPFSAQ